jgi:hypothetical protein
VIVYLQTGFVGKTFSCFDDRRTEGKANCLRVTTRVTVVSCSENVKGGKLFRASGRTGYFGKFCRSDRRVTILVVKRNLCEMTSSKLKSR